MSYTGATGLGICFICGSGTGIGQGIQIFGTTSMLVGRGCHGLSFISSDKYSSSYSGDSDTEFLLKYSLFLFDASFIGNKGFSKLWGFFLLTTASFFLKSLFSSSFEEMQFQAKAIYSILCLLLSSTSFHFSFVETL